MIDNFTHNGIEYTITGPIEELSNNQIHVPTDQGVILVDDSMDIFNDLINA